MHDSQRKHSGEPSLLDRAKRVCRAKVVEFSLATKEGSPAA